jgi:signal transduction histidine kinase
LDDPRDDTESKSKPPPLSDAARLELVFRPSGWPVRSMRPSSSFRPPASLRPTHLPPSGFGSAPPSSSPRPGTAPSSSPLPGTAQSSSPRPGTAPSSSPLPFPPPRVEIMRDDDPRVTAAREQAAIVQAQKLQAIGQLASGIAHEINTPTQFVADNLVFLQASLAELVAIAGAASVVVAKAGAGAPTVEAVASLRETLADSDADYLLEHVPRAFEQCLEGLRRVTSIVSALRNFSRPSGPDKQPVDLREPIESTIVVARNEWKSVAELETDFAGDLPPVPCLRDELGQVVLNLIVNAAHAIADVSERGGARRGRIVVSTRREGPFAEIRVRDTGGGIPEEIRHRVFEPFFTTKPFGKGSGQGLAIAWAVVVEKHGGTLSFDVDDGIGTTFVVRLPLRRVGGSP